MAIKPIHNEAELLIAVENGNKKAFEEIFMAYHNQLANYVIMLTESRELTDAVRNRSDKTTAYTKASFATNAQFLAAILKERQVEFLGDGILNADIMLLELTITAKPAHSVLAAAPSAPNYIYPIASDELILNKLMVDNN